MSILNNEPRGTCPRCGAAIVGTVTGPQDAEIERLRAALERCEALFWKIRGDWSERRSIMSS